MSNVSSNPPSQRPSQREPARSVRALDALALKGPSAPGGARLGSGVYRLDEYAGIDRLDRSELDETDDD
jgi:hypothetical protein